MKSILVILANYSPNPSSVANCMTPLIEKISNVYNVDIITNRKRMDIPPCDKNGNKTIYRVDDYRIMNTYYLNELNKVNSNFILKKMTSLFTVISKSFFYMSYVLFANEKGTGGWEIKRVCEKALELDKENNYDIIISISQPFQSHYIAEEIKKYKGDKVKWMVFEFDPFAYNNELTANARLRKKMTEDEKRILDKCDIAILTPELYEFYKKNKFIKMTEKIIALPFGNLEPIVFNQNNVEHNFMKANKINCLFTGQLYDNIRNPRFVLKLFSKIDNSIHLTLMTNFNKEKIQSYTDQKFLPSVIPYQNRDTALYNLTKADILINIGNTVEHQVPGKVFEYMSVGKPIIHFSKIKNDPAVKYLQRYPKVLIIKEWEAENRDYLFELENFCKENSGLNLSFDEINNRLGEYTGSAVASNFINIINDMLGEKSIDEQE